jgi:hypothetical protein
MTFIYADYILLTANALITGATEAPERKSTSVWRPVHKFVIFYRQQIYLMYIQNILPNKYMKDNNISLGPKVNSLPREKFGIFA